jgi:hypothetical protein
LSIDKSDVVRSNVVKFKTNLAGDQYEEVFHYTDLMSLCAAGLMSKIYHPFYKSLGFVEENPEEMEEDPGKN